MHLRPVFPQSTNFILGLSLYLNVRKWVFSIYLKACPDSKQVFIKLHELALYLGLGIGLGTETQYQHGTGTYGTGMYRTESERRFRCHA